MFRVWVRTVARDTLSSRAMPGPVEIALQEAQDLELPFAERLDQRLLDGRLSRRRCDGGQESAHIARSVRRLRRQLEERRHARAFVDEDTDVALGLGQPDRAVEQPKRGRHVVVRLMGERQQDQELDDAPGSPTLVGSDKQALQELDRRS